MSMKCTAAAIRDVFPQLVAGWFGHWGKYLVVFLTGFVVTLALTPLVRRLAIRFGVMDIPDDRRIHRHPTPRAGGIAVVLGFHAACLIALLPSWPGLMSAWNIEAWQSFLAASTVLVAVGLVDDIRGVKPWTKLLGQLVAASMMYFMTGNSVGTLMGFDLPPAVDYAVTVFWYLGMINSFNLIDGLDGLASGLAAISATGLALSFVFRRIPGDALVMLALIGSCLAFLRYNFHPASIFLGDSGSMFLGFALAAISLHTGGKSTLVAVIGMPLLAAGVPVFDTLLAIWRRSVRRVLADILPQQKKPGLMEADKDHLHHRFLSLGLTQRHVAVALYIVNAAMVLMGLLALFLKSGSVGVFLIAFVAGVYVIVRHLARVELWDTGLAIISGLHAPAGRTVASMFYPLWDVLCMTVALLLAIRLTASGNIPHMRETWIIEAPLWLGPIFIALVMAKAYTRVWSLAALRDYLALAFSFLGGLIVSLGIVALIRPGFAPLHEYANRALWVGSFSLCGMLLGRGGRIAVKEMMLSMSQHEHLSRSRMPCRTLVYGVNAKSMLLLRELTQIHPAHFGMLRVMGLLDDDPNLRGRSVRGITVLGDWRQAGDLIVQHRIHQVIVTRELSQEARLALMELSDTLQVRVLEWYYGLRPLKEAVDFDSLSGQETVFSVLMNNNE